MDPNWNTPLVTWTKKGLFCSAGNFYIDPSHAVDVAIVTHAHSDHARRGSKKYICATPGANLLKIRLGRQIKIEHYPYKQEFSIGDIKVSLHPAGHILGSAQVRIQRNQEVWVLSGDYKRELDPSCEPFEIVPCDTFITEGTFATPKFVWDKNLKHGEMIIKWWEKNNALKKNSILFGYSLGKAQRILAELEPYAKKPVLVYSTISPFNECYLQEGVRLAVTENLEEKIKLLKEKEDLAGELIIAPPSILTSKFTYQLGDYVTAFASGWMQSKNKRHGTNRYDHGFIMSDHADWNDLNQTIKDCGAKKIYVQHRNGVLVRHLRKEGFEAYPVEDLDLDKYIGVGTNLSFL